MVDSSDNSDFFNNLANYGQAIGLAANARDSNGWLKYGNNIGGVMAGAGPEAAGMQAAQANIGKTQAETAGLRQQNQLFPLQLQMMRGQMNLMNNVLEDQGQSPPQANQPVPTAGMVNSPTMGSRKSSPQTISRPVNNPGNLRPVGATQGFQQFDTPEQGENALFGDLFSKIKGNDPMMVAKLGEGYKPTLRNVLTVYAPPSENDTESYIQNVAKQSGIDPDKNLRATDLHKIIPFIEKQEGNPQPQDNAQIQPNTYEQQIQPTKQEKSYAALDKFMPGIGKIGEAQYQARIAPIVAGQKAEAEVSAAGAKKTAEETGANLADTTKSFNAASANLPRAMERFEELRRAAPIASSGGWGTDESKDDPGFKIRYAQQFDPKTATANNVISQISSQGILPEVGPVIQATGGRGNQFMEKMAATASGIKLADPPETKTQAIQNVRDQYIAQLKSLAAQKRSYGDKSAPSDEEIDNRAALAEKHAKLRMDAKEAIEAGAPKNAIIRRLSVQGIDTDGL